MTIKKLILALPVLCLACGSPTTDDANDAAGTASPYLAREVVGVHMLTNDANYDDPCNIVGEEYVRSTFKVGEETKIEELDGANGCEFEWGGNKVAIAFGGRKPYESIYQAEYLFNKMYQGKKGQVSGQMGETSEKGPLSGPAPEGTAAERPAMPATTETSEQPQSTSTASASASSSSSASATSGSSAPESGGDEEQEEAVALTPPPVSTGRFEAVPGVGDKAVWDAEEGAIHVLYNNHIISVTVETKDKPAVRKQRAQSLALVMLDRVAEGEYAR